MPAHMAFDFDTDSDSDSDPVAIVWVDQLKCTTLKFIIITYVYYLNRHSHASNCCSHLLAWLLLYANVWLDRFEPFRQLSHDAKGQTAEASAEEPMGGVFKRIKVNQKFKICLLYNNLEFRTVYCLLLPQLTFIKPPAFETSCS